MHFQLKLVRFLVLGFTITALLASALNADDPPATRPGYYRFPAIHGDTIIFTAEGDLWSTTTKGGQARRLTTNPGQELNAAISPDGKTVAVASSDSSGLAFLFDVETGKEIQRFQTNGLYVYSIAFSPDGKSIAAGFRENSRPGAVD